MKKYIFVDRDGTLIEEPPVDFQVDSLEKLRIVKGAISAMRKLKAAGFKLVMVTNQDGLGTSSFPQEDFDPPHNLMLQIFASEGVEFDAIHIDRHFEGSDAFTRKPNPGMLMEYLQAGDMDLANSYVIGDRDSDIVLAERIGVQGLKIGANDLDWELIIDRILTKPRTASITRTTKETAVELSVDLDSDKSNQINTGLGFFDHMLDQIALHAGFGLRLKASGDLHIDEHHLVEDVAIVLGQAIRKAIGDKRAIGRYGFTLPMDESLAQCAIDLSGRPIFKFEDEFTQERVGDLSIEMVRHFVHTLSVHLGAAIHMKVTGENHHHMVEAVFKSLGRSLRPALQKDSRSVTSSKGMLE